MTSWLLSHSLSVSLALGFSHSVSDSFCLFSNFLQSMPENWQQFHSTNVLVNQPFITLFLSAISHSLHSTTLEAFYLTLMLSFLSFLLSLSSFWFSFNPFVSPWALFSLSFSINNDFITIVWCFLFSLQINASQRFFCFRFDVKT